MFACMPRSFPSRLSDPCSTPIGRPSRVRIPDAPIRPAATSRPASMSATEAGSAPCQPQVSSAVEEVDRERLAILLPADAFPGRGRSCP